MNRRAFLGLLGSYGVAATVDRKYFFAPKGGWGGVQELFSVNPVRALQDSPRETVDVVNFEMSERESDFIAAQMFSMEEICAMFRVPVELVLPGSTYASFETMYAERFRQSAKPYTLSR
jgi:hypothetical protein